MFQDIKKIENILFLDIETASEYRKFQDAPEIDQFFWAKKTGQLTKNEESPADFYEGRSAIYSEFARVVVISLGYLAQRKGSEYELRLKSFADMDEGKLLRDFFAMIALHFDTDDHYYCGHNIREFDFPFLCRRAMKNGIQLPKRWWVHGKKPWQVNYLIDTLEMWKFGDYKKYISLDHLHYLLLGEGAKQDVDGSMVHDLFWANKDLSAITKYCESDVAAVADIFVSLRNIWSHDDPITFTKKSSS